MLSIKIFKTSISNLEKDQIPRTFLVRECQKPEKNWQRFLWMGPLANLWTQLISPFQTEVTLKKTDEEGGQLFHNIREPPWQLVGRFCHGGFKLKILCKANSSQKLSLTQHSTSLLTYMRMIWIYLLLLNYFEGLNEKYIFDRDLQLTWANAVQGTARLSKILKGIYLKFIYSE